jgi:hypothetical protein
LPPLLPLLRQLLVVLLPLTKPLPLKKKRKRKTQADLTVLALCLVDQERSCRAILTLA